MILIDFRRKDTDRAFKTRAFDESLSATQGFALYEVFGQFHGAFMVSYLGNAKIHSPKEIFCNGEYFPAVVGLPGITVPDEPFFPCHAVTYLFPEFLHHQFAVREVGKLFLAGNEVIDPELKGVVHIREFFRLLSQKLLFLQSVKEKKLTGAAINKILHAGRKPLKWGFKKKIIVSDPTTSLDSFISKIKEHGILEDEEVQALIALDWKDKRARVATLTAMTTDLRAGELLALRVQGYIRKILLKYATLFGP